MVPTVPMVHGGVFGAFGAVLKIFLFSDILFVPMKSISRYDGCIL